jgi:hypothetical protein
MLLRFLQGSLKPGQICNKEIQAGKYNQDLAIQGIKKTSDEAWKTRKAPDAQGGRRTGLGLYCQLNRQNGEEKIQIQASTSQVSSPLHAETVALLFATQVAYLGVQDVTFLTYNITLSKAIAAASITDDQVPWKLRQQIAEYKRNSEPLHPITVLNRQLDNLCLCRFLVV